MYIKINFNWPCFSSRIAASFVLLFLFGCITSCSFLKKSQTRKSIHEEKIDTSSKSVEYEKITNVEEIGEKEVFVRGDTLNAKGAFLNTDTTAYSQIIETISQKIETIIKSKRDSLGRVIGYDVQTKSINKPKTINVAVGKKTVTTERGKSEETKKVSDIITEKNKTTKKDIFRFNFAGAITISVIVFILLFFIYKYINRKR